MWGEEHRPERRAQDSGASRGPRVHGTDPSVHDRVAACRRPHPALLSLREALTTAINQRVAQRAARDQHARPRLVGHICERCLDAPAVLAQPAPWGGEMGVCATCQQATPASDEVPQAG
jgi:hypothetical protein